MERQREAAKVLIAFTFGVALGAAGGVTMLVKHAPAHQVYWAMGLLCAFGTLMGALILWANGERATTGGGDA